MKQESFFKSLATIGAGTIISLIIGALTTPIITRVADPVEYGQFSIFTMYTSFMVMFLCLGMDQSLLRFYYRSNEILYKKKLVFECSIIPLVVTVIFLILSLILIRLNVVTFEFDWICTVLLAVNILVSVVIQFVSLLARINYDNKLFASVQVFQKATYFVCALVLLILFKIQSVYALVIATVFASFFSTILYLGFQRDFLPGIRQIFCIDKTNIKSLLRFGYPYVFSMGIAVLFQNLDKLALNYYKTYEEVGIYASAMTFIALFAVVQSSFNTVWAPKAVEHYEKYPEDKTFFSIAFSVITVVMFAIGITLILFKDVFALLLGAKYREASYIMPFLIFNPIMYTISETTVIGVIFTKRTKLHIIIAGVACLTNLLGNILLVPSLGCRGAAISTGFAYIVFFLLRTLFSEKNYYIGFNIKKLAIITIFVIGYAAYNTFYPFNMLSVIFALICYTILGLCYRRTIGWAYRYTKNRFSIQWKRLS